MQLVTSPFLEQQDIDALTRAGSDRSEVLRTIAAQSFGEIRDLVVLDRLNALAWLAASGRLEVRLALRVNREGAITRGMYHEKIGIFCDDEDNLVAFSGSSNETPGGMEDNLESIRVFLSWDDSHGHARDHLEHFESLWANEAPGVDVIDFSEATAEILRPFQRDQPPAATENTTAAESSRPPDFAHPTIPDWLTLRDYQRAALEDWQAAGGCGILAMATGAGKTITALYLACRMAETIFPLVVVVVCPYINLARQWIEEMEKFGMRPISCFESRAKWETRVAAGFTDLFVGASPFLALVVTNRTFLSAGFQEALRPDKIDHLLVADEVHNMGAAKASEILNENIQYRLGLSATPERHHDEVGTRAIKDYFGEVVYEFSIEDAIERGALCPYRYHPVVVELSEEEADEYVELTRRIGYELPGDDDEPFSERLQMLLIQRARLLGSAEQKLPALRRTVEALEQSIRHAIVYCGDGNTGDERQITSAMRLLGEDCGIRLRKFTCEESMHEREEILGSLRDGKLDALVAIRCLDEGIDVPELHMGFILASSTNPRQFIQRRGRLLRNAPEKERAEIWDFVVKPPEIGDFNVERRLFKREMERIIEFCRTAENGISALRELNDLRSHYNLLAF